MAFLRSAAFLFSGHWQSLIWTTAYSRTTICWRLSALTFINDRHSRPPGVYGTSRPGIGSIYESRCSSYQT